MQTFFPPFYLMSIVAGLLQMPFGRFVATGTVGRFLRFGFFAFVPRVVLHAL
jgi:membrane protein YqaA with SNARE-associated domain